MQRERKITSQQELEDELQLDAQIDDLKIQDLEKSPYDPNNLVQLTNKSQNLMIYENTPSISQFPNLGGENISPNLRL